MQGTKIFKCSKNHVVYFRHSKLCANRIMLDSRYIHLYKIRGMLKPEDVKLNKNYLWDTMEIDWKKVTVTFNDNKINLPRIDVVRLCDKIKVRRLMNREPLLFHMMLKQGITWFTLETETLEIV